MGFFDNHLFFWLQPKPPTEMPAQPQHQLRPRPRFAGKRSRQTAPPVHNPPFVVISPPTPDQNWRTLNLDSATLTRISTDELLKLMADASPELSRALWDFLRFCNPGWTVTAKRNGQPYQAAQLLLDQFMQTLTGIYGAVEVPLNRLYINIFLRGGIFAEIVLNKSGQMVDLVVPDAGTARFMSRTDQTRGEIWQLGQWQNGNWVALNQPTVLYLPVDPLPDSPYGRAIVSPALFSCLFLIVTMHDLRRVVAQQGYPRIDLSLDLARLRAAMPSDLETDPEAVKAWVDNTITEIGDVYSQLEPDDAYVHTDIVNVNAPVGAINSNSLGMIDTILRSLERMAIRGLKSMPLLMGSNEAVSETHAELQWQVHNAGIQSLQHLVENALGRLLQVGLQASGLQCDVDFRFATLQPHKKLLDAQAEAQTIANAITLYQAGFVSQDEAAQKAVGHNANLPTPRTE